MWFEVGVLIMARDVATPPKVNKPADAGLFER